MIIGIDEAGRGALAGPVVAGAAAFKEALTEENCPVFSLIKDSKKLTDAQRRTAFAWLSENVWFGVGSVAAPVIDKIGIKPANEKAMNQALQNLRSTLISPEVDLEILVDGRNGFEFPYPSEDVVKGDEKILEISAASIIAKVTRDDYMINVAQKFTTFGFEKHKGYGAATHYELLDNGVYCQEHRQSYEPLKTWLNQGRLF